MRERRKMGLTIPTNWEDDYFDKLNFSKVEEIYGKLKTDLIGGGRSSLSLPYVNKRKFKEHIKKIHSLGIKFNYLMNATCFDNQEVARRGYKKLRKFLDWLSYCGVDSVTVSLPFLVQVIKRFYPHFQVHISTQVRVDCLERVGYWEEIGADSITLSYVDLNRNFKELKRVTANTRCELSLIANLICRRQCPYIELHGNFNAHASQKEHPCRMFALDYYCLFCLARIFSNPEEIIKACWIRPEDLVFFRKLGIEKFKLVERGMTTEALSLIVQAYTAENYSGNFMDLIPTMAKYRYISQRTLKNWIGFFLKPSKINIFKLGKVYKIFKYLKSKFSYYHDLGIYIDNKELGGVIAYFSNNDCQQKVCSQCSYCQNLAKERVKIQIPYQEYLEINQELREILNNLVCGKYFGYA